MSIEISVPDIGDFESVEIIELLVKAGDVVKKNDPVVTLESDKSSVEVPSPLAGKISALKVKIGDKVSEGSVLALIESNDEEKLEPEKKEEEPEKKKIKKEKNFKENILPVTEKNYKRSRIHISKRRKKRNHN